PGQVRRMHIEDPRRQGRQGCGKEAERGRVETGRVAAWRQGRAEGAVQSRPRRARYELQVARSAAALTRTWGPPRGTSPARRLPTEAACPGGRRRPIGSR